jgi:hypothetical protein
MRPAPVLFWTTLRQFGALFQLGRIASGDAGPVAAVHRSKRHDRAER